MRHLTSLIAAMLLAGPAFAGGRTGATQYPFCEDVGRGVACIQNNGVLVLPGRGAGSGAPRTATRARSNCVYPLGNADSIFVGGAGYRIKDNARAALGCR